MKFKVDFKNINQINYNDKSTGEPKSFNKYSLSLSVDNSDDANAIALKVVKLGEQAKVALDPTKFIKANTYNEKLTYRCNVECSKFTFDRVERFATLEIDLSDIEMAESKGYINAKIAKENGKEKIKGYQAPSASASDDGVDGWLIEAPKPQFGDGSMGEVAAPAAFEAFAPATPTTAPPASIYDPASNPSDLPF